MAQCICDCHNCKDQAIENLINRVVDLEDQHTDSLGLLDELFSRIESLEDNFAEMIEKGTNAKPVGLSTALDYVRTVLPQMPTERHEGSDGCGHCRRMDWAAMGKSDRVEPADRCRDAGVHICANCGATPEAF